MKKLYSLDKFMEIGTLCLEFTYFNSKPRLLKLNWSFPENYSTTGMSV